jgi:hypothetical protein
MEEKMLRIINGCFAILLLTACTTLSVNPQISESIEGDATANKSVIEHEQEKFICESKGGYYSKVLGCFE